MAAGLNRGGFWDTAPPGCSVLGNYRGRGPDVWYTCNSYDTAVTEARIALYIGIARGQIPPAAYFATWRTFPASCDWSWQEQQPVGVTRTYLGIPVFEGAYRYRGIQLVPSWGGDMFESLMPDLFVPEAAWGPRSWRVNHPRTVRAQIEHGLARGRLRLLGLLAVLDPGRRLPRVRRGRDRDEPGRLLLRRGADQLRRRVRRRAGSGPTRRRRTGTGWSPRTPSSSPCRTRRAPRWPTWPRCAATSTVYGDGGFYDSVAVRSGTVSRTYLALDQAMVMGALGNVLTGDLHRAFARYGQNERRLRPLIGQEVFSVGG